MCKQLPAAQTRYATLKVKLLSYSKLRGIALVSYSLSGASWKYGSSNEYTFIKSLQQCSKITAYIISYLRAALKLLHLSTLIHVESIVLVYQQPPDDKQSHLHFWNRSQMVSESIDSNEDNGYGTNIR